MAEIPRAAIGQLLSLIVHDLRNPTATVSANLAFVQDVVEEDAASPSDDLSDALTDADIALHDLMRGLDQLAWVARWLAGEPAVSATEADVVPELHAAAERHKQLDVSVQLRHPQPLRVRGGSAVSKILDTLLANSLQHAGQKPVLLSAYRDSDRVVVEVRDAGRAVAECLREHVFTLEGQSLLKGRSDGRYGRVAGFFAIATLAESIGATLQADGVDGDAVMRVSFKSVET